MPNDILEQVMLVDEHDRPTGTEEKRRAHEKGLCHRAFSVFVFHRNGGGLELLLQQRHPDKYHSGGLWTNTCCSHPRPGEEVVAAAERRLREEMGLAVGLRHVGTFRYRARLDNGLIENELDHVLIGFSDATEIHPDPREVAGARSVAVDRLARDLRLHPERYTPWLPRALALATRACREEEPAYREAGAASPAHRRAGSPTSS